MVHFWFIQINESFSDHMFKIKFGLLWKINFGPLLVFDATKGSKVDQNLFFDTFKVDQKWFWTSDRRMTHWFINLLYKSKVDQNLFRMHIQHVKHISFTHFTGPKFIPPRIISVIIFEIATNGSFYRQKRKVIVTLISLMILEIQLFGTQRFKGKLGLRINLILFELEFQLSFKDRLVTFFSYRKTGVSENMQESILFDSFQ